MMQTFTFYRTSCLNEEVNRTELSLQLVFSVFIVKGSFTLRRKLVYASAF